MKTLYTRIVITFILIAMISGIIALLVTNSYYLSKLKGYNEEKLLTVGEQIKELFDRSSSISLDDYLMHVGEMGFQIYSINERLEGTYYGGTFDNHDIDPAQVQNVLQGNVYRGYLEGNQLLKITGYFENSVRNSIGIPIVTDEETYAVFIRPNLMQQIGDVRILLALLIGHTFLFSLIFIVVFTRYIVRPLKGLTEATKKIVDGNFQIAIDMSRKDEIGELARHFTYMAQSLQQLDEMRQEFVSNVSHEIQSPLTSIRGFAQALQDKETTLQEKERYLQVIEEESRRLSDMSRQLLTLAALDKDTGIRKRTSFRLDEQLRQVLIVTEPQWSEKQLVIEPELPETIITTEQQLLYQVWQNLITNSIKFTPPEGTIRIELLCEADIVVKISDTGVGIAESDLPYIFDRFYKTDKTRSRSQSGSGIGLSIVKKIVERIHGTIEVRSELGKGTMFIVTIPSSKEDISS